MRKALSAVSRFKHQPRRFRPNSDFDKADRAQLKVKNEEKQSRLGKFVAKYKASIIKVWSITANILLCTFDSGTDGWAARAHYM